MNAMSLIRWSTVAAVADIAGVAGWVSYEHALAVVRAHGELGAVAAAYPVTIDGLIYSASMVLLDSARRGVRAPALARWLLAVGIGATLVANVAAGIHFGVMGAVVAAWPALALVGSYELLMLIIRREAVPAEVTIPAPETAIEAVAAAGDAAIAPIPGIWEKPWTVPEPDTTPDTGATPGRTLDAAPRRQPTTPLPDTERRAKNLLKRTPEMSGAELARRLGLPNDRAGQRLKAKIGTA